MMTMAVTSAHVSVEEYLGTTYHPDCDYVDGELLERNLGEWEHGELEFGVPHVWLIDPSEPSVKSQVLRAGQVAVPMEALFD